MIIHPESKSILLKVKPDTLATLQTIFPHKNKTVDYEGHNLALPYNLTTVKILRNMGIKAPSPIRTEYSWPRPERFAKVFDHQYATADFCTLHNRLFVLNEMGCVDSDTEYLSPTGWKKIRDYDGGQVTQYHLDSGVGELVQPTEYVKYPCAEMIRFKTSRGIDQKLSAEHRVLYWGSTGKPAVVPAHEVEEAYHTTARGWSGQIATTFSTNRGTCIPLTDEQLRVQVAVIADGHFGKSTDWCVVRVKKPRKIERMQQLLGAAGIEYALTRPEYAGAEGFAIFKFHAPIRTKEFGAEFWAANPQQLSLLADELYRWDGCVRKSGAVEFYSTSKASADFAQYVYAATGHTASVKCVVREVCQDLYVVHARAGAARLYLKGASSGGEKATNVWREPSTDGFKYCFEVPATYLVMRRNGCIFITGNTSKTASMLWAMDYLMQIRKVKRVLIVAPLSTLEQVWLNEVFDVCMHRSALVLHGSAEKRLELLKREVDIYIINHDGLKIIAKEVIGRKDIDLVIVDEAACFAAGTTIATPNGDRVIEDIRTGDTVTTSAGARIVTSTSKKNAAALVKLELSNGKEITATAEHPIFTDLGWVCAAECAGRRVLHIGELSDLSSGISDAHSGVELEPQEWYRARTDLLTILRSEADTHTESRLSGFSGQANTGAAGVNIGPQVHIRAECSKLGAQQTFGNSSCAAWGERDWDDPRGRTIMQRTANGFRMGLRGVIGEKAIRLSYQLQSGLRKSGQQDSDRGRWEQSPGYGPSGARPEERSEAGGTWVDSVTHIECGSGADVFNLTVAGCPHYFAGGILVHNCYRNGQTERYAVLKKVAEKKKLWLATGAPCPNAPTDAWSLSRLVDASRVPEYFTQFKRKTMNQISTYKWVPKVGSHLDAFAAMQPAIRFKKSECLELPSVTYTNRACELSVEQEKAYTQMKNYLVAEAATTQITAVNAADKIGKLRQILCGCVKVSGSEEYAVLPHAPRLKVLIESIEQAAAKVLIIVPFKGIVYELEKEVQAYHDKQGDGRRCAVVNGDVSLNERNRIFQDFRDDPSLNELICHPQVMSHGLNMTQADMLIFYAPIYSNDQSMQVMDRINRPGQTRKMTILRIAANPLERAIYAMVEGKRESQESILALYRKELQL